MKFAEIVTTRRTTYLEGFTILVAGRTTVSRTVAAILSALGARVRPHYGPVETVDLEQFFGCHAVVHDLIDEGTSASRRTFVDECLAQTGGAQPLTWVSVSPFGLDGPSSAFKGSDFICAASGGLLSAVRDNEGRMIAMPGEQALRVVGQAAALATIHALSLSRERKAAVHLDVSAQEAVAFCSVQHEILHLLSRCGGLGGSERYVPPTGVFACSDGALRVMVLEDHQFVHFAQAIGLPELAERFPTTADRREHSQTIIEATQAWTGHRTKANCEFLLQAHGVAATAVRNVKEARTSEQFVVRQWTSPTGGVGVAGLPAIVQSIVSDGNERRPDRVLSELRVVEISNVLAGPLAGAMLGAMGAEVIRLEDRRRLDVFRANGPFVDGVASPERAAYFHGANYSKRSVTFSENNSSDVLHTALRWGHILLENVGATRLANLGMTPAEKIGGAQGSLRVSLSGFGRTGPSADFKGYAPNIHAFAGLEAAVSQGAASPVYIRTAFADLCTAVWATTISAAWWLGGSHDEESVDLSMAEIIVLKLSDDSPFAETELVKAPPRRNLLIDTKGGLRLAVTLEPHQTMKDLFTVLGHRGEDEGLCEKSVDHFSQLLADDEPARVVQLLQGAGIIACLVRTPGDLVVDEELLRRDFFTTVQHPEVGPTKVLALPWKVVGECRSGYRSAPLLGMDDEWAQSHLRLSEADTGRATD